MGCEQSVPVARSGNATDNRQQKKRGNNIDGTVLDPALAGIFDAGNGWGGGGCDGAGCEGVGCDGIGDVDCGCLGC
jgi:hypothetical protein